MAIEQITEGHQAKPFVPFDLITADGGRFHVAHPEYLAHPRRGSVVVVFDDHGIAHYLDLLLVSRLEVGGKRSNGRRRAG